MTEKTPIDVDKTTSNLEVIHVDSDSDVIILLQPPQGEQQPPHEE